jgi:hypothetical protein
MEKNDVTPLPPNYPAISEKRTYSITAKRLISGLVLK